MTKIDAAPKEIVAINTDADSWKAWLDDLPLDHDYGRGVTQLQEFISTLVEDRSKLITERDAYQTELVKVILALPRDCGMRAAGAAEGVKAFRAVSDALVSQKNLEISAIRAQWVHQMEETAKIRRHYQTLQEATEELMKTNESLAKAAGGLAVYQLAASAGLGAIVTYALMWLVN